MGTSKTSQAEDKKLEDMHESAIDKLMEYTKTNHKTDAWLAIRLSMYLKVKVSPEYLSRFYSGEYKPSIKRGPNIAYRICKAAYTISRQPDCTRADDCFGREDFSSTVDWWQYNMLKNHRDALEELREQSVIAREINPLLSDGKICGELSSCMHFPPSISLLAAANSLGTIGLCLQQMVKKGERIKSNTKSDLHEMIEGLFSLGRDHKTPVLTREPLDVIRTRHESYYGYALAGLGLLEKCPEICERARRRISSALSKKQDPAEQFWCKSLYFADELLKHDQLMSVTSKLIAEMNQVYTKADVGLRSVIDLSCEQSIMSKRLASIFPNTQKGAP